MVDNLEQTIQSIRRFKRQLITGPDAVEKCRDFLVAAGIYDRAGKLKPYYRQGQVYN